MTPEEHNRIVQDGLRIMFGDMTVPGPNPLIERTFAVTERVKAHVRQLYKDAILGVPKKEFQKTAAKCYLDEFARWNRDDLIHLCTILHVDVLVEALEN